ncbi:MAG: zf-HC2 domain-containing protein [Gemmatimonadetes bacterium]|nr:zf-HC2 domain-containing protein [Gemmatimonadota bacterium]
MKRPCDEIRDVLPTVVSGRAEPATEQAVQAHLAGCEACRAEAELIALLRRHPVAVPNGLEEQVLLAAAGPRQRRASRGFLPQLVAVAAAVVLTVLGIRLVRVAEPEPSPVAGFMDTPFQAFGPWAGSGAFTPGSVVLEELTEEQLELLLAEMES